MYCLKIELLGCGWGHFDNLDMWKYDVWHIVLMGIVPSSFCRIKYIFVAIHIYRLLQNVNIFGYYSLLYCIFSVDQKIVLLFLWYLLIMKKRTEKCCDLIFLECMCHFVAFENNLTFFWSTKSMQLNKPQQPKIFRPTFWKTL